jgi:hypothetical protein
VIEKSLLSIAASGSLAILGGRGYSTENTLTDAGRLYLSGGVLQTKALVISAGGTVAGVGMIASASSLADNAVIEANGGTLVVENTITGSGALQIDGGATLELTKAVVQGMVAIFSGANARLKCDNATSIRPIIAGFAATDRIDLAGITVTAAKASGTHILVTESNGKSLSLALAASLSGGTLSVSADGAGGSFITAGTGVHEALAAVPLSTADFAPRHLHDMLSGAAHLSPLPYDAVRNIQAVVAQSWAAAPALLVPPLLHP